MAGITGAGAYDYALQIAKGAIDGHGQVNKFGSSPATTTESEVWSAGGAYTGFLTAASAVRVAAGGNAADAAAGTGARSVTISGLDETWAAASETVAMNADGTLASAPTTTTFIRVFRAFVASAGDYAAPYNVGDIVIETTGGAVMAQIDALRGQTTMAIYTVPTGKMGYLLSSKMQSSSTRTATFRLYQRRNADDSTAPVSARRLVAEYPGIDSTLTVAHSLYAEFPAMTDLFVTCETSTGTADVSAQFELVLVDE